MGGDELERHVLRVDRVGELDLQLRIGLAERLHGVLVNVRRHDLHLVHEVAEADGADVDDAEALDARRAEVHQVRVAGAADAVARQRVRLRHAGERPDSQVLGVELVHAPSRASYSSERKPRVSDEIVAYAWSVV